MFLPFHGTFFLIRGVYAGSFFTLCLAGVTGMLLFIPSASAVPFMCACPLFTGVAKRWSGVESAIERPLASPGRTVSTVALAIVEISGSCS